MYHQQHTKPEYSQKQNFATSPKPTFHSANCSDDQAKSFLYKTSFRRPVGAGQERKRGKLVYMAQSQNPISCVLWKGSTLKHGTTADQGSVCASDIFKFFFPVIMCIYIFVQ